MRHRQNGRFYSFKFIIFTIKSLSETAMLTFVDGFNPFREIWR